MAESMSRSNRIKILLGSILLSTFVLLVVIYYSSAMCIRMPGSEPCLRVLFIGNSYTYMNDLPHMFAELARSGGHKVDTNMAAEGGLALSDQVNSSATLNKLKSSKWDFVVLQEQSQLPADEYNRTTNMYPAASQLVHQIEDLGATPMFFMTWAHRDGWPEAGLPDYQSMQFQIDRGYLGIAQELGVPVAPVGYAWLIAIGQNPQLDLWQEDGSHPTEQGTYLAACVFYAAIFRQSPAGLAYLAGLPKETAHLLQTVSADIVLSDPKQWYLP